jgi:hypothetical protein
MFDPHTPTIASFSGHFFDVIVWAELMPPDYQVCIQVKTDPDAAEASLTGINCPKPEQVSELIRLLRGAEELITFLKDGGELQHWRDLRADVPAAVTYRN